MRIYIISRLRLQRELIAQYLESQDIVRCECRHFFSLSNMVLKESGPESPWPDSVILWDAQNGDSVQLWSFIHGHFGAAHDNYPIMLFNVCHDSAMEKEALDRGFMGVFYQNDDPSVLLKGLQAVVDGQFWFSRKVMHQHLTDIRKKGIFCVPKHCEGNGLTRREKEVLRLMTSGVNNHDISEKLCISLHTVKTHITNIYRKIEVANRLQAILWAHKNI